MDQVVSSMPADHPLYRHFSRLSAWGRCLIHVESIPPMEKMIEAPTLDTRHASNVLHHDHITQQTTLYDLMQAMQDEAGPDEDHLVVDAVMQLLRNGQIRFLGQSVSASMTSLGEALPISA